MSCEEPQQELELEAPPELGASQKDDSRVYQQFIRRIWQLMHQQLIDDDVRDEPLVQELRYCAKFNDFPLVAAFVKRAMGIDLGTDNPDLKGVPPLRLLTCFGKAFRGDEVGHIGRDILTPLLGNSRLDVRTAAVDVLEQWIEYDDDGMWLEMVSDHFDRETSPVLQAKCETLIDQYDDMAEAMLQEMMNDCPECNEGHVLQDVCWYCDNCGHEWGYDPIEHEYEEAEDEDVEDEETMLLAILEEDDDEDPAELKQYRAIHRGAANNLRAVVETRALPGLLESVLDLHPHLTLDFIESINIGHLSVRATRLGLCLDKLRNGVEYVLRGWDEERGFCFSIEPSATDDTWLVFMRY